MFIFDERIATLYMRSQALGLDLDALVKSGKLTIQQVDPAEMSPGELACVARAYVEEDEARVVVIDSLNGYLNAMPEEKLLTVQLHELLSYLGQQGVTTLLVMAQHGLLGEMESPVDVSYLADTVLLLRYFETRGEIRKAISVVKKRSGKHERTIRELTIGGRGGIEVGDPLRNFGGILTGVPKYLGTMEELED
jgi:circadian clock protein KaiC